MIALFALWGGTILPIVVFLPIYLALLKTDQRNSAPAVFITGTLCFVFGWIPLLYWVRLVFHNPSLNSVNFSAVQITESKKYQFWRRCFQILIILSFVWAVIYPVVDYFYVDDLAVKLSIFIILAICELFF